MDLGVVGPRVVFWDVFERPRWTRLDTQVEHQGGGPARVVGVDREVGLRDGRGRCAPNGPVGRAEGETRRKGRVDGP